MSNHYAHPHPGMPPLDRLAYFYGQMLTAADLRCEQAYFREKLKLHNRCLHGHGVVCGLEVEVCITAGDAERKRLVTELLRLEIRLRELLEGPQPGEPAEPGEPGPIVDPDKPGPIKVDPDKPGPTQPDVKPPRARALDPNTRIEIERLRRLIDQVKARIAELDARADECGVGPHVKVHPGLAIDAHGNEIIVREPLALSLWTLLSPEDRQAITEPTSVYLSARWCERPIEPVRPVLPDACGVTPAPAFAKLRDALSFEVGLEPPPSDERCEPCCSGPGDTRVLLARVDGVARNVSLDAGAVDNSVRRMLAPYVPTRITGVSWTHGAGYTPDQARVLLGSRDPDRGLELRFSRPVHASTLRPGVIDLWVIDGGQGRNSNLWHMSGEYIDLPAEGMVESVRYRQTTRETLQDGDRVMIFVRGAFILDHCCQPVAGTHVGGRVPLLPGYDFAARPQPRDHEPACAGPPHFPGPWTSGADQGGTTFESWFYIHEA
ncbi:hypothetical protein [Haliangium sp.]|uniref:hypothetical protein n=1 Tax=Haliangium sp. TaxID=2663208 RepID=UPI003D0FFBB7